MRTDITEALHAGAPIPTGDIDLEAIQARLRRRRRRHRVVASVLVAGIVVPAGTAIALVVRRSTEPSSVTTHAPPSQHRREPISGHSTQGPVSLNPPEGWHALPPGTNPGPSEILTVATVRVRPTPGVITGCAGDVPSGLAAYISIYEYQPGSPLIAPTNETFSEGAFQPRPQRFDPSRALGGDCPDPLTAGTTSNHFRMLPLTEQGRRFLIRVVTTGDPNGELLAATGPILDTLRIGD